MSGPPGGRTLPQTPTRLSDLTGGIYGPGASVASSGFGAQRPAIKAGVVRAAGETWEDVLDYYMVRFPEIFPFDSLPDFYGSSMPTEARLTSRTALEKYITKAVFMPLLVASLLVAKASVPYHAIMVVPGTISSR